MHNTEITGIKSVPACYQVLDGATQQGWGPHDPRARVYKCDEWYRWQSGSFLVEKPLDELLWDTMSLSQICVRTNIVVVSLCVLLFLQASTYVKRAVHSTGNLHACSSITAPTPCATERKVLCLTYRGHLLGADQGDALCQRC